METEVHMEICIPMFYISIIHNSQKVETRVHQQING